MTDAQDGFGAQFEAARQRGDERLRGPRAVAVHYDAAVAAWSSPYLAASNSGCYRATWRAWRVHRRRPFAWSR